MNDINETVWRYSSKTTKFFIFDYRLLLFFTLFLLHMRLWTAFIAIISVVSLYIIEVVFQYQLPSALRRLNCFLSGKFKPNVSNRRRTRTDR